MDDWERMQREAERRVMNSRRQNMRRVGGIPAPDFIGTQSRPEPPKPAPAKPCAPRPKPKPAGHGLFDLLNIGNMDIDGDRSIILMMLALLGGEESDELLTLALLYIML